MNDKKQIFGWAMYDWANSAYATTVNVAVLPIFFAGVIVPKEGFAIGGTVYSAESLWAFMISAAAFFVFICAPVLGAISDFSASKKKFLMLFCYLGSLFTILLYFCNSGDVWQTIIFFIIAQIGFVGGNVFYDSFLPHLASEDKMDWVSGQGFAYGYVGGGLQFAISLGLIAGHETLGLSSESAAKIAMTMAGLWWAGFAAFTFVIVKEPVSAEALPARYAGTPRPIAYLLIGLHRTIETAKMVRNFEHLLLFLIAFMVYNEGIQTVITMATMYGKTALHFSSTTLMLTLLIIQFIAIFGALAFGKLGEILSTKKALLLALVLWSGVVIYAYFMTTAKEYYLLGVIVGIVMGGSQALSRSLYGAMIPPNASAEFYGLYSVFSKFSAIWGPLVFGIIRHVSGEGRTALVSLIVFFIAGIILLSFVNVEKAKAARHAFQC